MAPASALSSSVYSFTDTLSSSTVDRPEFGLNILFPTCGDDSFDGLSQSFRVASVETHCFKTLDPKPDYLPTQERLKDLTASGPLPTLLAVPPCTPEDSIYLQYAGPDCHLNESADNTPAKRNPIMLPVESSNRPDGPILDPSSPLADVEKMRPNREKSINTVSGTLAKTVLKEDEEEWTWVDSPP